MTLTAQQKALLAIVAVTVKKGRPSQTAMEIGALAGLGIQAIKAAIQVGLEHPTPEQAAPNPPTE